MLIDSMMLTLFLALLALPFGTIGLFGLKPAVTKTTNIQVLGDKSTKYYKVNKVIQSNTLGANETSQSTSVSPTELNAGD